MSIQITATDPVTGLSSATFAGPSVPVPDPGLKLFGATINPAGTKTADMPSAVSFWTETLGLPLQSGKIFISSVGQYPTTLGTQDKGYINAKVAIIPMFKPTIPFVTSEPAALMATVSMWRNAGGTVPFVCLYNEVTQGTSQGKPTASDYLSVLEGFQSVRSTVGIYLDAAGNYPNNGPSYWDPSLHDGLALDYYTKSWTKGITADWANELAANCPFAFLELGNDETQLAADPYNTYMQHVTDVVRGRVSNNQPIASVNWWESSGPGLGYAPITAATGGASDPRLPALKALAAALA